MYYSVTELKPNVYHIADPVGAFMTVVVGEKKALLLDTGYGAGHLDKAVAQITDLPLIVVNSHGHVDHVSGNRFFDQIYLHPADLQLYQNHTARERKLRFVSMQNVRPELFPADFSRDEYVSDNESEIIPVNEGDVFDLGGVKLTVVHVPGHTAGGIALLDDRDRLLLSGDAISPHVWIFFEESNSIDTYIQSLKNLLKLGDQYDEIVASHVPVLLQKDMIDRLIHCAENIDPEVSVPFDPPFDDIVDTGLMYYEGFESLKEGLGLETLDLATQPFYTLNLDGIDLSKLTFVSIVYNEAKL